MERINVIRLLSVYLRTNLPNTLKSIIKMLTKALQDKTSDKSITFDVQGLEMLRESYLNQGAKKTILYSPGSVIRHIDEADDEVNKKSDISLDDLTLNKQLTEKHSSSKLDILFSFIKEHKKPLSLMFMLSGVGLCIYDFTLHKSNVILAILGISLFLIGIGIAYYYRNIDKDNEPNHSNYSLYNNTKIVN
jgi:hypothetical protein